MKYIPELYLHPYLTDSECERVPSNREQLENFARDAAMKAEEEVLIRLDPPSQYRWPVNGWTCPECGEVFRERPEREYPRCACQRSAYEQAYEEYKRRNWLAAAEGQWQATEKPKRYADVELATFQVRPGTEEALEAVREYVETFEYGKTSTGLWLVGGVGSGKTHLALAVARELIRRCLIKVKFWQVGKLLYEHKRTWADREVKDPIPEAAAAELLILDDLGQVIPSSSEADLIFMLLNERYGNELPTIVTSNLVDTQMEEVIGLAAVSRLRQMCKAISLHASDYRLEQALSARK